MKKYSFYLLAAAFLVGGCKKQLDQSDPESVSDVNAFTTFDHVQLGVNGAFGRYTAYASDIYKSALISDEAKLGADNAGQGALEFRYQYSSDATTGGSVTSGYYAFYNLIDQVNRVLPHVYEVAARPEQLSRKDVVQGQLLALRALAHFDLLENFSKNYNPNELGIAVTTSSEVGAKPARNTMGETMAQIEKDLSDAKALMSAVTPASFTDTVMNKINIAAYQARIALYKGDYPAAITYSTEVINSNVKPLVTGGDFNRIWTDSNSYETLFRIRYATSTGIGEMFTTTSNLVYLAPSDKLTASYGAGDIRKAAFIGNSAGKAYINKFYTSARGGRIVDMKACRTAEMYLIRAEAYAKKPSPDLVAGAADLNTLRTARITGYTNVSFGSAADLVTAVLDERFKELCFEGFRIFDLKRNNLPVQRSATDASPAWQTLPANSYRFIFPIPLAEINANPNIKQNDGY